MASRVAGGAVGAAKGYWQTSVSNPDAGFGDYVGAMASNAFYGIIDPISTSVSFATSAGGYYGAKALGAGEEEALMAMMVGDLTGMVAGGSIRSFKEALGRGAGMKAARTSALLSVAVDVGGMSAGGLYAAATGGDVWSGMQHGMTVASAGMAGVQLAKRICFAPETPLLTPGGAKPISEFKVGDYILSAADWDPNAPVSVQLVEEVFENYGRLLNLHVGGQVVRTTAEHPFYVRGKGWIACEALEVGDLLRSHDGRWVAVEEVTNDEEESVVYNLRVSEYHTYFVGEEEWGFSVWAHNVYDLTQKQIKSYGKKYAKQVMSNEGIDYEAIAPHLTANQRCAIRQYARQNLLPNIPINTRTKFADFSSVAHDIPTATGTAKMVKLPKRLWKAGRTAHFDYLNKKYFGGVDNQPAGTTWHHHEYRGQMQLVPSGLHEAFGHYGGMSPGRWGYVAP